MSAKRSVIAVLALALVGSVALAAPGLKPGGYTVLKVELPRELRQMAGRGQLSPVKMADVVVVAPANFDAARDWPVMVISATSDRPYQSSRLLLVAYTKAALEAGWILIAADPDEEIPVAQDDVPLRYALNIAALAALELQWPGAARAPLAFGGFSGGSKYAGWLAAGFASRGRSIAGIYLAGCNQDTVVPAARLFDVLNDAYRRVPIFLQSGEMDVISTMADHQRVMDEIKGAGFRNVRIEYCPGPHDVAPRLLRTALDWFREVAEKPPAATH
jgi:predicted esterase